jgi:transposase-like protein
MERKRRRFSEDQKEEILQEHRIKGVPISVLARVHGINAVTLYQWKRAMRDKPDSSIDVADLLKQIDQLKKDKDKLLKKVGESSLREEVAQDIIDFYKKKTLEQELIEQKSSSNSKKKGQRK